MLSKSYFDAGNQISGIDAKCLPYEFVTLAAMSGLKDHWTVFELGWRKALKDYGVDWLHTTDAVGLEDPYTKLQGWDAPKRDKFINRCVSVIEKTAALSRIRIGIRLFSVTVKLEDFRKALLEQPDIENPAHVCAVHAVHGCLVYGSDIGGKEFELFFDQGEPFYGYIHDRWKTLRVRREEPTWERVIHVGEANMRKVPALQAADLLAWSVNHATQERVIRYDWQERVLNIEREREIFDYEILRNPLTDSVNRMKAWRLPPRRRYK